MQKSLLGPVSAITFEMYGTLLDLMASFASGFGRLPKFKGYLGSADDVMLAWETTTPPMLSGSNSATGVMLPTLPTWKEIVLTFVEPTSAGNFLAIAHLGALET